MASNSRVWKRRLRLFVSPTIAVLLFMGGLAPSLAGDPKQEAKARFAAGQSHYNLNEFSEALQEFKEGYRIYPDPVFLYNLGQCERQLGHTDEAVRFYRNFLREQPKAPNRQEVLNKISELEASKAKAAEPTAAAKPIAPPPAAPPTPLPAVTPAAPAATTAPAAIPSPVTAPTVPPPASEPAATSPLASTPPVAVDTSMNRADLTATAVQPTATEPTPFYKRWWFWTAAAVVVGAGIGIGIYAATSGGNPSAPSSNLGSKKVF